MPRTAWSLVGLAAYLALLFVALFGARLAPHEPIFFVIAHGRDPRPYEPGVVFPFGSDVLGRDLFSLVLAGAGTTLTIVVLGGLTRVAAGVSLAAIGGAWSAARLPIDLCAELVSAVPATLVALLAVKVFVRADASVLIFIAALLVTGWAGPYRVVRSELDRLQHLAFTEGAVALGAGRVRIFAGHHLPHLVPVLAMNVSQQVLASLVLLAELGVLGVFVGATRVINISASLPLIRAGPVVVAPLSDPPEWGGLLANARSIESLWTTRWLFLVPGVAFAFTAVAVVTIGFALARRYAHADLIADLRGRAAAAVLVVTIALVLLSAVVPERYAEAKEWSAAARNLTATTDVGSAFASSGLRPVASTFAVERDTTHVIASGPATVMVGSAVVSDANDGVTNVRPFVAAITGGGRVDAPLVFASRGLSPTDYPPVRTSFFAAPDLGETIKDLPDDYAAIDVRGKVVLLVRLAGVMAGRFTAAGPPVDTSIANAVKRGAAAVLFVDPNLPRYTNVSTAANTNPYRRIEDAAPIEDPAEGVPVVVLSPATADRLLATSGLSVQAFTKPIDRGSDESLRSASRDLGMRAVVDVPLKRATAHVRSLVGEVDGFASDRGRVLVWAVRRERETYPATDVLAALARELTPRGVPFIFVDFDPSVDPKGNARQIADVLKDRRIALILVLDDLEGAALRFTTPYGDLIPMIDHYADESGARHVATRSTLDIGDWVWPGSPPFFERKGIVIGATEGHDDLRGDAAALVAYLAGRLALGAEDVPR